MKRKFWPPGALNLNADFTLTADMFQPNFFGKAQPSAKQQVLIAVKSEAQPQAEPADMFPAGTLNHKPWSMRLLKNYGNIIAYHPGRPFDKLNHKRLMIDLD